MVSDRRIVLVGGGVRSGKSAFAVALGRRLGARRAFVATARAYDDEMRDRIARHVVERGAEFRTVEEPVAIAAALRALDGVDVAVVDCLTLWLSNLLIDGASAEAVEARVEELAAALAACPFHVVLVTNEVGMGVHPESALGRLFRDLAGRAHQRLARSADEIYFAVLGLILRLKPAPIEIQPQGDPP